MWRGTILNIRSLFPVKDKNYYKSFVIYEGNCSCGSRYIGETKRNAEVRWNGHKNSTKSSEPWKHLRSNINHYITWTVISYAPKNAKSTKNLETSYIVLWKSDPKSMKNTCERDHFRRHCKLEICHATKKRW